MHIGLVASLLASGLWPDHITEDLLTKAPPEEQIPLQGLRGPLNSQIEIESPYRVHSDAPFIPPIAQTDQTPSAIVIWHGLGDNYNSLSMNRVSEIINLVLPSTYVHSVHIDTNPSVDERRSFLGDANDEVDLACEQLSKIPQLKEGFGAIGFSQGGLLMRALVERCPNVSVSTLVTFGSPHMGVLELPMCKDKNDWLCQRRNKILKKQVWNPSVRKSLIPAQYFRDLSKYEDYLKYSHFLADINNERKESFDDKAKSRLSALNKLVLVKFDQDTTLVPKESAFFQEIDPRSGDVGDVTQSRLYQEDLIGLKSLHKNGRVDFFSVDDVHMAFSDSFLVEILAKYFVRR